MSVVVVFFVRPLDGRYVSNKKNNVVLINHLKDYILLQRQSFSKESHGLSSTTVTYHKRKRSKTYTKDLDVL